jgi:hypothetical protein
MPSRTRPRLSPFPQKPADWYTNVPLRGSGKHGHIKDDDFLCALQITREEFKELRRTCIRRLDEQCTSRTRELNLRQYWGRESGTILKAELIEQIIHDHGEIFNSLERFETSPPRWTKTRTALAEACIRSANTYRSRQIKLLRRKTRERTDRDSSSS